mmetsp:Transcript_24792/g.83149  ORF Transcript_24792/g.83149 Transcript_24792/m.83149 type:complete len:250 (+) Transcript_24792:254-1003(+)
MQMSSADCVRRQPAPDSADPGCAGTGCARSTTTPASCSRVPRPRSLPRGVREESMALGMKGAWCTAGRLAAAGCGYGWCGRGGAPRARATTSDAGMEGALKLRRTGLSGTSSSPSSSGAPFSRSSPSPGSWAPSKRANFCALFRNRMGSGMGESSLRSASWSRLPVRRGARRGGGEWAVTLTTAGRTAAGRAPWSPAPSGGTGASSAEPTPSPSASTAPRPRPLVRSPTPVKQRMHPNTNTAMASPGTS